MGPGQEGTWNKVAKPMHTGNMISDSAQGSSRPTAKALSSKETVAPENTMATATSKQSTQKVGNGSVKKSGYKTPSADLGRGTNDNMEGGRGLGGY